jgi:hypothetical protein
VPSSVQRYHERVADRKKKHRLSFDFANPTLNRVDTLSTTIEMSSMGRVSGSNNSVLEKDGFDRASTGGEEKKVEKNAGKRSKPQNRQFVSRPESLPNRLRVKIKTAESSNRPNIELVVRANDAQASRRERIKSLQQKRTSLQHKRTSLQEKVFSTDNSEKIKLNPILMKSKVKL